MTWRNRCLVQGQSVNREIPTPAWGLVIETFVPWKMVRRGVRKRIITPLGESEAFVGKASTNACAEDSPLLNPQVVMRVAAGASAGLEDLLGQPVPMDWYEHEKRLWNQEI